MFFNIYFQDLNNETLEKIREKLRRSLQTDIEEAISFGIDRETAETEIVNEYLNCHNFGVALEL